MYNFIKSSVAKKIVDCAAALAGATFIVCFFWSSSYYYGNYPSQPNQQAGRFYPLNNHGYVTYLTYYEHRQREVIFDCEMYVFMVGSVLVVIRKKIKEYERGAC